MELHNKRNCNVQVEGASVVLGVITIWSVLLPVTNLKQVFVLHTDQNLAGPTSGFFNTFELVSRFGDDETSEYFMFHLR
jgi:hypothetical protein